MPFDLLEEMLCAGRSRAEQVVIFHVLKGTVLAGGATPSPSAMSARYGMDRNNLRKAAVKLLAEGLIATLEDGRYAVPAVTAELQSAAPTDAPQPQMMHPTEVGAHQSAAPAHQSGEVGAHQCSAPTSVGAAPAHQGCSAGASASAAPAHQRPIEDRARGIQREEEEEREDSPTSQLDLGVQVPECPVDSIQPSEPNPPGASSDSAPRPPAPMPAPWPEPPLWWPDMLRAVDSRSDGWITPQTISAAWGNPRYPKMRDLAAHAPKYAWLSALSALNGLSGKDDRLAYFLGTVDGKAKDLAAGRISEPRPTVHYRPPADELAMRGERRRILAEVKAQRQAAQVAQAAQMDARILAERPALKARLDAAIAEGLQKAREMGVTA